MRNLSADLRGFIVPLTAEKGGGKIQEKREVCANTFFVIKWIGNLSCISLGISLGIPSAVKRIVDNRYVARLRSF
jgi:hypothetical protein